MRSLEGEQVLMRLYMGEDDSTKGRPTWRVMLELLREEGIAGATVLRGIAGYGGSSELHTGNLLRLSGNLPVVLEAVDTQEHLDRVLPKLDEMLGEGLITMEKVRVLRYRPEVES
jgi:PII-like signaling protein